jgi:hypothetical protein
MPEGRPQGRAFGACAVKDILLPAVGHDGRLGLAGELDASNAHRVSAQRDQARRTDRTYTTGGDATGQDPPRRRPDATGGARLP